MGLEFVETKVFTRRVAELGLEDQMRGLQQQLLAEPEAGDVDPGTGGLRKIRIADPVRGKGKRGGARAHYLFLKHRERVYLLYAYGKNEVVTLTSKQKAALKQVVESIKRET